MSRASTPSSPRSSITSSTSASSPGAGAASRPASSDTSTSSSPVILNELPRLANRYAAILAGNFITLLKTLATNPNGKIDHELSTKIDELQQEITHKLFDPESQKHIRKYVDGLDRTVQAGIERLPMAGARVREKEIQPEIMFNLRLRVIEFLKEYIDLSKLFSAADHSKIMTLNPHVNDTPALQTLFNILIERFAVCCIPIDTQAKLTNTLRQRGYRVDFLDAMGHDHYTGIFSTITKCYETKHAPISVGSKHFAKLMNINVNILTIQLAHTEIVKEHEVALRRLLESKEECADQSTTARDMHRKPPKPLDEHPPVTANRRLEDTVAPQARVIRQLDAVRSGPRTSIEPLSTPVRGQGSEEYKGPPSTGDSLTSPLLASTLSPKTTASQINNNTEKLCTLLQNGLKDYLKNRTDQKNAHGETQQYLRGFWCMKGYSFAQKAAAANKLLRLARGESVSEFSTAEIDALAQKHLWTSNLFLTIKNTLIGSSHETMIKDAKDSHALVRTLINTLKAYHQGLNSKSSYQPPGPSSF